jgi:hypothetical protein
MLALLFTVTPPPFNEFGVEIYAKASNNLDANNLTAQAVVDVDDGVVQ